MNKFQTIKSVVTANIDQQKAGLDDLLLHIRTEELNHWVDLLSGEDIDPLYALSKDEMKTVQTLAFMTIMDAYLRRWEADGRENM